MGTSRWIAVSFAGPGAGVEPLSWGQWELWEGMRRLGTWMPQTVIKPLPPGTTVDDAVRQLRFQISRYQTMRTRLRFDPDGPKQVVAGAGEIELEVVGTDGTTEDPAKLAEDVAARYRDADFDLARDWPVRRAVITHRGVPTHQVAVACRLVTDAAGAAVMGADLADLAARDPETGEVATPPAGLPPTEQARWQRSPAGRRHNEAVLRQWERVLRTIPARRFGECGEQRQPRYWRAGFSSPAAHLALRAIAARTRSEDAPVLLAVYAVALARVTAVHPVMTRVIVNNRFRPGLAGAVCPLAQTGPFVVDVAGTSFDEVLARTQRRTLATYKYAYHDPSQLYDLVARVSRERGEQVHIGCFFDDRRRAGQAAPTQRSTAVAPAPEEILAARPHTGLHWERGQDEPVEELFVHVNNVPDTMDITVQADTHRISADRIEAFLRGLETVAVEAAFDPAVPTRVPSHG